MQDRDLASLSDDDRHTVRRLQREYVELWIGILSALHPDRDEERSARARARVLRADQLDAAQLARPARRAPANSTVRGILESMAFAALTA